jgi:hypothetical protein
VDGITGEEDQERGEEQHPAWCAHRWPHNGRECSGAHRRDCGCKTNSPSPSHLALGELIDRLRQEPDPLRQVRIGFRHPHSYRGYYMDLAFERAENVTVGEMLAAAESALDATFQGWKGGDYTMSGYTDTWLVEREGCVGETIGAILLDFLLQDPEAAYRAGREDLLRSGSCPECAAGDPHNEPDVPHIHLTPYGYLLYAADHERPGFIEEIRAVERRAGREDAARNALIIRGDLDITTVVAALDRAGFDCPDDALRDASADLLQRLPVWQGSDGRYRPRIPKVDQPGVQPTEEQRAREEDQNRDEEQR